ncbi:unnamed protein product, partial [Rotaria sp. Silwood2]
MVGIDARNKYILDTKYICPVCSLILRDPVQLSKCGHRQCQTCLNAEQETTIKCRQCHSETSLTDIVVDRGFKNDMKSLDIDCSFCQWTETLDQSHLNLKCEYCGEQLNSVEKINQHDVSECQKLTVNCILKEFGCNERIARVQMKDHYLTEQHQRAIINIVRQMFSQLNDNQMKIDLSRTTTAAARNPVATELEELYEIFNILIGGIETLTNDEQRLTNESLQIQIALLTLKEDLSKVKLSIEESNAYLDAIKHNQDILNQDFTSLEEKINDLQYVSYDGTLIWKIINVREKM